MDTATLQELRDRLVDHSSRGLANAVGVAIANGVLAEGDVLPPIRIVASELCLSPSTVSAAWRLLSRAGAIHTDGRHGTTVTRGGPGPVRYRRAVRQSMNFKLDLSTGMPDLSLLPDLTPTLQALPHAWSVTSYLDDPIIPGLVDVLAQEWPYSTREFAIVDGALDALDLIGRHLFHFGDLILIENPEFPAVVDLFEAHGVRTMGVNLDQEGLIIDDLVNGLRRQPRALFLQPRAQNPSGVSMSERRATQIAEVLAGTSVHIIEDDYIGGVAQSPNISLGRWLPGQTIHVQSFSKSHGPDLRLAAVSGPAAIVQGLRERRLLGQGWTSRVLQSILLDVLCRPKSIDQVTAARNEYARRYREMSDALKRRGVSLMGYDGINLWLPVQDETTALLLLASRGIGAAAGSPFNTAPTKTPHLRITVGLVASETERVAEALSAAAEATASSALR